MGIETAIMMGLAAGQSAYNIIKGSNAKADANQAAASAAQSLAMKELDQYKSLKIPTLGLELAQQNLQQKLAGGLQALQQGGASTVLGGLTALNQQAAAENLQLSSQAQEAEYARNLAQAQNAQAVAQRNAARQAALEQQRLAGAQNAAAYGQAQIESGMKGLVETAGNVLTQSLKEKPLFNVEDTIVPGTKNQELYDAQQLSNQMYNQGQQVLRQPIQTGLQAIPNINVLTPQQLYMQGLRGAQGQFDNQYQWSPGLGWAQ